MVVQACPVVLLAPAAGAEPRPAPWCWGGCSAGNRRRKGLAHAARCTALVTAGSSSGHAGGCTL